MTTGGRILLTSSVSARISVYQHTLYAASKAAVSAMVLNLAPELAERGIAINAIAPALVINSRAPKCSIPALLANRSTPPELGPHPLHQILRLGRVFDIGAKSNGPVPGLGQLAHECISRRRVGDVVDCHRGALGREATRDRGTDTAPTAGDQGPLTRQPRRFHHDGLPPASLFGRIHPLR